MNNDAYVKQLENTVDKLQKELDAANEEITRLRSVIPPVLPATAEYGEVSFHGKKYKFAR